MHSLWASPGALMPPRRAEMNARTRSQQGGRPLQPQQQQQQQRQQQQQQHHQQQPQARDGLFGLMKGMFAATRPPGQQAAAASAAAARAGSSGGSSSRTAAPPAAAGSSSSAQSQQQPAPKSSATSKPFSPGFLDARKPAAQPAQQQQQGLAASQHRTQPVETPEAAKQRREAEQKERERQQQRAREEQAKQEQQARISATKQLVSKARLCPVGSSAVGDFCQQLTRLLDQHPELQQQVQSGDGMVLLWRLATGCPLSTVQQFVQKVDVMKSHRSPKTWVNIHWTGEGQLNSDYRMLTNGCRLWESVIKHRRWDVLVAMLQPRVDYHNLKSEVAATCLALLQLVAAEAPADTVKQVMADSSDIWTPERLGKSALAADVDPAPTLRLYLYPPVLAAYECACVQHGGDLRPFSDYVPLMDALGLAVKLKRTDLLPELLRYTRWGGALVDASTAANYGFSPTEWARGTTDYRNSDREAILEDARMYDFMGPHPHGYRIAAFWQAVTNKDIQMLKLLLEDFAKADGFEREVLRNSRLHHQDRHGRQFINRFVWVPDNALHLDALFSGTSPLQVAVNSGQHQAAELLLAAGAHPQRACFVDPADAYDKDSVSTSTSSSSTTSGGGKKKKKGAAASKGGTQASEGSQGCWTTPLHEAARRTDVRMLKLLLTQSKHELVGCSGVQHGFPPVEIPTDHIREDGKNSVHALLQKLPLTLLDGAGQTPLSLALSSSSAAAAESAVLLLDAGLQVLQPVKALGDFGRDTVTHALLLAAKVDSAGDARLRPFINKALRLSSSSSADSSSSPQSLVRLDRAKDVRLVFDAQLPHEDVRLLGGWLAKQPEVLAALHGMPRKQLVTLMEKACQEQPMAGHMFLDNQVLAIVFEKQREVNLSLGHIYSSLLNKALQQDGGAMLDLLLQRIHWEPQSVTFSGLNLVHPGAIKEVAAHLPKLLEVGLPPDCRDVADTTPLSQLLLPLGAPALQPLLDTQVPAVFTDTDKLWGNNLLHAAAAVADPKQRLEAVKAVAKAAGQLGLTSVFGMQNGNKKTPATVCKNLQVKMAIGDAKQEADRVAAAARRREQQLAEKAAAEAAKKAAAEQKIKEEQAAADAEAAAAAAAADAAAAAEAAAAQAAAATKAAAAAAPSSPRKRPAQGGAESEVQKKRRLTRLMALIPDALQAAAGPARDVTEAAAAAAAAAGAQSAAAHQLSPAERLERDNAVVHQRVQAVAPEQLPEKSLPDDDGQDAAAGAGGQAPGAAAAAGGSGRSVAAAATAAALALDLEDDDDDDPVEGLASCQAGAAGSLAAGSRLPAGAQSAAAAAAAAVVIDPDKVDEDTLTGLPWEFTVSREALVAWMRLDSNLGRMVTARLQQIGQGTWVRDGVSKRLATSEPGLELWRTKFTRGGRIIWQVAVDYSEERHLWTDMIRVWAVHDKHDRYERALQHSKTLATIIASHRRSMQVRQRLKLVQTATLAGGLSTNAGLECRAPCAYERMPSADDDDDDAAAAAAAGGMAMAVSGATNATAEALAAARAKAAARADGGGGKQRQQKGDDGQQERRLVEHLPPANGTEDVYTLLKLYSISKYLVRAVLRGQREDEVEFPFRVSEQELSIIERQPSPPASLLLLGRSGTGKTTVLVFRMFFRWLAKYHHSDQVHYQAVFVTASKTLKEQVASTFRRLQAAAITDPVYAARVASANREPANLINLPGYSYPLFFTTRDWLKALDASCEESFFVRTPDGRLLGREIDDWDGIGLEVDLGQDDWLEGDEEEDAGDDGSEASSSGSYGEGAEEEDQEPYGSEVEMVDADEYEQQEQQEQEQQGAGAAAEPGRRRRRRAAAANGGQVAAADDGDAQQPAAVKHLLAQEVTYADFVSRSMWDGRVTKGMTRQELAVLKAPLVYAEIMSFIKGSAESLENGGYLTQEQYLEVVGRKRAPNFTQEQRPLVYRAWQQYERAKASQMGWDRADLAAHLYRQLVTPGAYRGDFFDAIYRDEVQDFTQAELCLDLRVCINPNDLFYCGDTCQTIARGIGFRFEDVKVLMYQEGMRRRDEGVKGQVVNMPEMEVLTTNYRTHAGILDAAASITSVLSACFPHLLDKLPRERAFFPGPQPLLLGSLDSMDDLSILLSSDPGNSAVEWGAHQVILVRDLDSRARLPAELQHSNALIMTVAQSKGLEFDDVFLVDFFSDSPVEAGWRVLLQLLAEYEAVVETIAKYAAALQGQQKQQSAGGSSSGGPPKTWEQLATSMTAGELRKLVSSARTDSHPATPALARAAVNAADHSDFLKTLPTSARLVAAPPTRDGAQEAGWLRPLDFNPQQHSLLCEELKHLYVGLTRAKNFCVVFDRNGAQRAPLYHFLRRLDLGSHVSSVLDGGLTGAARGSLSNNPLEWSKRAANLVEMKLFKLAAQCFGSAGDVLRAAAYGAMDILHELYTSTQEASTAAAASTGKRGTAAGKTTSRLDRREALVAAADVLLTCAVEGGNMARSAAPEVAARTRAALLAAAERSGLSVPPEPVVGAVAPPITSPEALRWLQLSARAFKAAGWKLQAGQLLLGLGDEDGGIHRRAARRLLQECEEKREVARIYEAVARQEMGLSASGDDAGTDAEAPGSGSSRAVVPKGVSAGFAASSRLLLDAWRIHLSLADYDKCRQLWQQWPGLKSLHKEREIDEFNMAWINTVGAKGSRQELLSVINSLSNSSDKEALLKRHGFTKELARTMQDDAEAARLLASGGDYLAAAERCLQSKKFLERATLGQLLQLHGWLLRVGTTHAASLAVDLWDEQIAAGRLQTDYIEAQAAARLALGRGLLREAVGAAAPVLSVKQQGAAEQSAADGQQQGKQGKGKKKQKSEASYAKAAAKAAAAAAAPRTPQPAPLPTASLAGLHQQLQQPQPETGSVDAAQLVRRAVSVLSDAQQGFITANQPAGVLEALSWGLAAKPLEEITVGQWQLSGASSSSRLCDALEVVGHTQQTVALLQALASTVSRTVVRGRGAPTAVGRQPLTKDRISQLLRSLERFYGIKPLADNTQQMPPPLAFRNESVMFVEALAALATDPSSSLKLPEGASGRNLESALILFTDAVKAIAAHLYGHASAALARCVRAAVQHLAGQRWLQLQMRDSSGQGSGVAQVVDMEATREALKQSLEVLLLALSAFQRLKEAAAVLKGCPQLAQLAANNAFQRAEVYALQLSSLVPSLEWPPYDPGVGSEGYDTCSGTAGAMPVMQDCLRQLLKHEPLRELIDRKVLDGWRFQATRMPAAADLLDGLAAADPAAALWTLRTAGYSHTVCLEPSHKAAQIMVKESVAPIARQWQSRAQVLADRPDAYQLVLQEGPSTVAHTPADKAPAGAAAGKPCLDAELLLRARRCMVADQPAQAGEALLLLLERSLLKEQLAVGLLQQEGAGSSSSGSGQKGQGSADVDPWAKVRPLPPDVCVQLLESCVSLSLLGLSTAVSGQPQLLLTESAVSALHDPVLLPPGHPGRILACWLQSKGGSVPAGMWGVLRLGSGVRGVTEKMLLRVLRVCTHLADTNWRGWLQDDATAAAAAAGEPEQAAAQRESSSDAAGAGSSSTAAADASTAGQQPAAAAGETASSSSAAPASSAKGMQGLPTALVFSEWMLAVVNSSFKPDVLYAARSSAQRKEQQQEGAALGAATAALMPVLAARLGLLLCCLVADLSVLQAAEKGGRGLGALLPSRSDNQAVLLLLSATAAKQVLELAADLATAQHRKEAAAGAAAAEAAAGGGSPPDAGSQPQGSKQQQPHKHWLMPGLRSALKAVNSLLPTSSSGSSSGSSKAKDKRSSNSMQLTHFSENVLLPLARALGMKLLQVSTQPGEAGGTEKAFTGLASKNRAVAAQDKLLSGTVITVTQSPLISDPAALLALPPLEQVHLQSRISPEELRKRAARAAMVAEVRAVLRERRWQRLAAHPEVHAGIQRMLQRMRDRIRERAEQEAEARRAETAALEAAAAAALAAAATVAPAASTPGGAPTVTVLEQRQLARQAELTPQMEQSIAQVWWGAAGDLTQPQAVLVLQTCWLVSSACYYGTVELQKLQAVFDQLSQGQAAGFGAGLCPVCKDTTQNTWDSWGQQLQPQQPGAAAAEPKGQLSVGAAEYVPHAQRDSHQESTKAFHAYKAFVAQQVRFLLFEAAQAETNAEWCVNGRPVETVQKLMIRRDALIQAVTGLLEAMQWVLDGKHWSSGVEELQLHLQKVSGALVELQPEVIYHNEQRLLEQQQQEMRKQGALTLQQVEAQLLPAADAGSAAADFERLHAAGADAPVQYSQHAAVGDGYQQQGAGDQYSQQQQLTPEQQAYMYHQQHLSQTPEQQAYMYQQQYLPQQQGHSFNQPQAQTWQQQHLMTPDGVSQHAEPLHGPQQQHFYQQQQTQQQPWQQQQTQQQPWQQQQAQQPWQQDQSEAQQQAFRMPTEQQQQQWLGPGYATPGGSPAPVAASNTATPPAAGCAWQAPQQQAAGATEAAWQQAFQQQEQAGSAAWGPLPGSAAVQSPSPERPAAQSPGQPTPTAGAAAAAPARVWGQPAAGSSGSPGQVPAPNPTLTFAQVLQQAGALRGPGAPAWGGAGAAGRTGARQAVGDEEAGDDDDEAGFREDDFTVEVKAAGGGSSNRRRPPSGRKRKEGKAAGRTAGGGLGGAAGGQAQQPQQGGVGRQGWARK